MEDINYYKNMGVPEKIEDLKFRLEKFDSYLKYLGKLLSYSIEQNNTLEIDYLNNHIKEVKEYVQILNNSLKTR